MGWWKRNNLRMIQNNIRDIDGKMDAEKEVEMLKSFGANVLQIGCGGISSFIPAERPFQRESPYLNREMFGDMVRLCHENGIKVIARFDLSKTHESFLDKNPGWFSRTADGEPVRYNDTYATCVNGEYQRKLSLEIIENAVRRYPVDGIFFNAFGYSTRDYSGRYIGICQCENCKTRFKEMYGKELPVNEDKSDPVFILYEEFKHRTVDMILEDIHDTVKAVNPDIAVSTYAYHKVDIVRDESNSAVDRPYPFWIYSSSDNTACVRGSFPEKIISNCAINAVDIPYRFMGVSKYLNQIRLYGNIANNSGLDWCIIGSFEDYPDRDNFEMTREVFHFHKTHEEYFGRLESQAKILLVENKYAHGWSTDNEYRGIFKALKESHRLFDCVQASELDKVNFDRYKIVILPSLTLRQSGDIFDKLKRSGACVIATGLGLQNEPDILKKNFGIELLDAPETIRGSYMETTPKQVFKSFEKRDWVYLDKEYRPVKILDRDTQGILPFVSPAMYGPPERCFGYKVTDTPCITIKNKKFIYITWMLGDLYYNHGYEDFKQILLDVMDKYGDFENPIKTNAPNMVEVFFDKCTEDEYLLQFINLTGFNGTTAAKPVTLSDIEVSFSGIKPVDIHQLTTYGKVKKTAGTKLAVEDLGIYKAYLIKV